MNEQKTLNIDLSLCEGKYTHMEGFVFTFFGHTEGEKLHKVNVKMNFCSLGNIADEIWKLIGEREKAIENVKRSLRNHP